MSDDAKDVLGREVDAMRSAMRRFIDNSVGADRDHLDQEVVETRNALIHALTDSGADVWASAVTTLWAATNAIGLASVLDKSDRDDAANAMAAFGATLGAIAEGLFTEAELPKLVTTDD
jgi:hypothetical protein